MVAKKTNEASIEVMQVNRGRIEFCVLGETPMIMNRLSEKTKHELLMPKGRKTAADKAGSLKHDPYQEFRDSPYLIRDDSAPTFLAQLATCFKKSLTGAALDIPGSSKAQMGRLVWVDGERIPVYGVPKLFMAVTRSADMNRTPDVRTRVIVPAWACKISISYIKPIMKEQTIINLFAAAGMMQGVGDWRPQKGSGTYGQYQLVSADDDRFLEVIENGGRASQVDAMANPKPYDEETEELMSWFDVESKRRGFGVAA